MMPANIQYSLVKAFVKKLISCSLQQSIYLCIPLFVLLIPEGGYCQSTTVHDTTYYQSFQQDIIARIFFSQKYTNLELKKGNDAPRLRYRPNTNLNLGIGATYRNFTLNLAYGFGFLNSDEEKGKTKKLDLQARLYQRKWAIDLYGQFYKDYFEFPKGRGSADNTNYYIRHDLRVNVVGLSLYKIFNYERFTLHPAFNQDEVQKKSAGSILAGAQAYYGSVRGDSALVPSQLALFYDRRSISKVRIFEIGPGVGYAYTQVLPSHFYLTGSFTLNVNLGLVMETGATERSNHVSANANMLYRLGGGYNSGNWNVNAFWVNTRFAAKGAVAAGNNYLMNTGNYRLIFSKRLEAGPKLKKVLRPLDKLLPVN